MNPERSYKIYIHIIVHEFNIKRILFLFQTHANHYLHQQESKLNRIYLTLEWTHKQLNT